MSPLSRTLRIGISLSFAHPDADRALFRGKTLQYLEEHLILSVARSGAVPIPLVDLKHEMGAHQVLDGLDGLIFSGGADLCPQTYGEEPLKPAWSGDPARDAYELRLFETARERSLPMLGICRGAQLLNVALGGTLYQDIATQVSDSLRHRDPVRYDQLEHPVTLDPASWVGGIYASETLVINTVHHQAAKDLAPGLTLAAWAPDGIPESYQRIDDQDWIVGIQWHPEWLNGTDHRADGNAVFREFYSVCALRHEPHRAQAVGMVRPYP
ncbi:gamma-glutamyl-gamma-aminobutyrate hydrolase family protein [Anthocerotibacter panamensis]|uniref:gamma-glutamyl-gamma-aminobutyrate hydrolase family protein n=1 Tax=Anthocerotibacter panamensis TaxID=2857077 RepID=UPI001C402CC3|nr:gamma-glutamyl-gamma-aminobutyrate hydrolase family protein [Anthocerotibacter panamensis]